MQITAGGNEMLAAKTNKEQHAVVSTKEKVVVPENAYAADWEEVTALMDEVQYILIKLI